MQKKIVSIILSLTLAAGFVSTALAGNFKARAEGSTADQLYASAYSATINATNVRTQKAINEARTAILKLKGTDAAFAIGEFSQKVDQVQHPILVRIVQSIKTAETNPIQDNINLAKASIDLDLPDVWRNSYSSAVDVIQQGSISKANAAYEKALKSQSQTDIDIAFQSLNEVAKSKDSNVLNWANAIKKQLEENISFTVISIE
jgi:hypothetical protein